MIFVTLGSQKFQFNRLLKYIDKLVEEGTIAEDIFAQICVSDYTPKNYDYKPFINGDEFIKYMKESDVIITHGGTATIINAIKLGKKVIAMPRLAKHGEHVDDHQIQIIDRFSGMNLIYACHDYDELKNAFIKINSVDFKTYQSNTHNFISDLDNYISNTVKEADKNIDDEE